MNGMTRRHPPGRLLRRAGFTLVELMVSVLIGFAVVGALLAAYMAAFRSTAHNDALSQLTEDATLALSVMRGQAAMAGYSTPYKVDPVAQVMLPHTFPPIYGCAGSNFATPFTGILTPLPCTGVSASDTLEVAYEVHDNTYAGGPSNAVLNAAGLPLDCLGNVIPITAVEGGYYLADSKFYVSGGKLYCQGPGSLTGAPLVDNVDQMTVRYGYADANPAKDTSSRIAAYMQAPAVPPDAARDPANPWSHAMSITICVVVRSTSKAIEPGGTGPNPLAVYVDCDGNTQYSPDGLLRRSFSTTVVVQSKIM